MQRLFLILAVVILAPASSLAATSHAEANATFDRYVATLESQLDQQHRSTEHFLATSDRSRSEHSKDLLLEKVVAAKKADGGMIHHWRGTLFVPGATAADFLRVMQDPNRFSTLYSPQVLRSRLVGHRGDAFDVEMRLSYRKVLKVTLDTRYDVEYGRLDPAHGYSLSQSTRISEIADANTPQEHALAAGEDHGFLWRLNTYWSYAQVADGLWLQCETVSLTRDIPFGLHWAVEPFVSSVPRESLEFTLSATRNALVPRRNYGD